MFKIGGDSCVGAQAIAAGRQAGMMYRRGSASSVRERIVFSEINRCACLIADSASFGAPLFLFFEFGEEELCKRDEQIEEHDGCEGETG
jgi:hypothetical protein